MHKGYQMISLSSNFFASYFYFYFYESRGLAICV